MARPNVGEPRAHVDDGVEHLALHDADELDLVVGVLEVHPPQGAAHRAGVVVLDEPGPQAGGGELRLVVDLDEPATGIAEDVGFDEDDAGKIGGHEFHAPVSSTSAGAPAGTGQGGPGGRRRPPAALVSRPDSLVPQRAMSEGRRPDPPPDRTPDRAADCPPDGAGARRPGLLAGVARATITPPVGIALTGFAGRAPSTGVHDDLTATALVLAEDGGGGEAGTAPAERVAIVALDLLGLYGDDLGPAIKAQIAAVSGIPAERVLLCCSHTHYGPVTHGEWEGGETAVARAYWAALPHLVAGAVAAAAPGGCARCPWPAAGGA